MDFRRQGGRDAQADGWPLQREPYVLETTVPGVFVAGDVRARSIKRIASAVGEGSMAVSLMDNTMQCLTAVGEERFTRRLH